MNQKRLTNYSRLESEKCPIIRDELLSEITNLLSLPSNYEFREPEGKI
jgi:hypothetical protein